MIRGYLTEAGRLRPVDGVPESLEGLVWIDLDNPSRAEEQEIEARLAVDVPTREEMQAIEVSSRLYLADGAAFMTAMLPAEDDGDHPQMAPVTFVLAGGRLITVRYHEPRAFQTFPARAEKVAMGCDTGEAVLVDLLEAVVNRLADILERAGGEIDAISHDVFRHSLAKPTRGQDFQTILIDIGRKGDLTSKIRDSLVTLERLLGFLGQGAIHHDGGTDFAERVGTLSRDTVSLADHASFLAQKVTFLLNATLGMINIEQNAIIKIFSVAAVVFLPPTLIASIYGMNFRYLPELDWLIGYPFAVGLMVVSAVLPFVYFKCRGWL